MNPEDIFSADRETIDIPGLDGMIKFTRFKPQEPNLFIEGLELSEDLKTESGTVLYTKGTEISRDRIARLLLLRESKPDMEMVFHIQRSEKLIQKFREEILARLKELLERSGETKIFRNLIAGVRRDVEAILGEFLAAEKVTLFLYKMRFICDSAKTKRALYFFDQALNVAIFSLAIGKSERYAKIIDKDKNKLLDLVKAGLFHNYGALARIDEIMEAPEEERIKLYWEANRKVPSSLTELELGSEVTEAIRLLCEYHAGSRDFLTREEWQSTIANIILVADTFLMKESGLFKSPIPVKQAADQLNLEVMEKKLNSLAVQALTLGLNLQDIFDFYHEMDALIRQCPYTSACPYPMTGFKSPTIFVCKNNVTKCPYLELSIKAVNLVKELGELKPGEYHRCALLTPKLLEFYNEHYTEIKESVEDVAQSQE